MYCPWTDLTENRSRLQSSSTEEHHTEIDGHEIVLERIKDAAPPQHPGLIYQHGYGVSLSPSIKSMFKRSVGYEFLAYSGNF
jgi:hypothetical protein